MVRIFLRFPTIELNTEGYWVSLRIQFERAKTQEKCGP